MDRMTHRALLLLLGGWLLSACPAVHAAESPLAMTFQETVDRMQRLKPDERDIPAHFIDGHLEAVMRGGEFDVQEYFAVLKHVSMEEGYTLDYVYQYGDGWNAMLANKMLGTMWLYPPGQGHPILYARKTQDARLLTYSELLLMVWDKARLGEAVRIVRESEDKNSPHDASLQKRLAGISQSDFKKFYLEHVRTDGSQEGWLELMELYLLGGQFYLFWHANYDDAQIVATSTAALGSLRGLSDKDFARNLRMNDVVGWSAQGGSRPARSKDDLVQHRRAFQDKAAALDLEPVVQVADQTVKVSLVTFSKWGGFVRRTFEVNRSLPHTINERDRKVLLPYECGVLF